MACRYRNKELIRKAYLIDRELIMYDSLDKKHIINIGTILTDFPEDDGYIPNYKYIRCFLKKENLIFLLRYDGTWVIYKEKSKIIQQVGKLENREDIKSGELVVLPIGVYYKDGYQYVASLDLGNPTNIFLSTERNTVALGQLLLKKPLPLGRTYDYALAINIPVKELFAEDLIIIMEGKRLFINKEDYKCQMEQ